MEPDAARTHYVVLGVPPDAAPARIRRAYRDLARRLHPDVNHEADAAARFSELQRAYETLAEPARRAAYDLSLAAGRSEGVEGRGGFGAGARQAHYSWTNVASPGQRASEGERYSDFEDLYATFFAARAAEEAERRRGRAE